MVNGTIHTLKRNLG